MIRFTLIILTIASLFIGCSQNEASPAFNANQSATGIASSLAKFTISGNTLYYADFNALLIYDITIGEDPRLIKRIETGIGIETIFPYEHYLFLGGQLGIEIYDISSPQEPRYTSNFVHSQSCDPVIVKEDVAYVTLRQSSSCNSTIPNSVLTVLNVSDINNPLPITELLMEDPYGLTFYKDDLYVSEGDFGLKKFNISDPFNPILDTFYRDIPTYDLLGLDDVLLVTGSNGLYSFDVVGNELIELAKIER